MFWYFNLFFTCLSGNYRDFPDPLTLASLLYMGSHKAWMDWDSQTSPHATHTHTTTPGLTPFCCQTGICRWGSSASFCFLSLREVCSAVRLYSYANEADCRFWFPAGAGSVLGKSCSPLQQVGLVSSPASCSTLVFGFKTGLKKHFPK